MAILLRVLLVLGPMLALILWLRHRAVSDRDPEALAADVRKLTIRIGALAAITLVAALAFYFSDSRRAPAGAVYIPPHMENGVLVQGRFVTPEEAARLEAEKARLHSETDGQAEESKQDDDGSDGGS